MAAEIQKNANHLFPVFLRLEDLHTLIVGGGNVALEKLNALLKESPKAFVTIVSEKFIEDFRDIDPKNERIRFIKRRFRISDLAGKDIVILATSNNELNLRIRLHAKRKRILIYVTDAPELCDFYLGTVVTKGDLKLGISTNGKSHTFAKRIREFFDEIIPDDTSRLFENLQLIRLRAKNGFQERVRTLNEITSSWLRRF